MARRSARKAAQVVLVARPSPPDAAGARQRQTLRAGSIWLKSFGFRLGRGATTTFTETLDLEPNGLRQSDPVFTGNALDSDLRQKRCGSKKIPTADTLLCAAGIG